MKMIKQLTVVAIFVYVGACTSFKEGLVKIGGSDDAIQNAILDFTNTTKLYKEDDVFSVSLQEVSDEELLVVRIGKNSMKLLLTNEAEVGSYDSKLPTRFIEKDGKLFFWWDDDFPITEGILSIFAKYDLLQDDENGTITFPEFTIDDDQKAAHYYFCKNDLTKYKKAVTNKGIGNYSNPSLNCSK